MSPEETLPLIQRGPYNPVNDNALIDRLVHSGREYSAAGVCDDIPAMPEDGTVQSNVAVGRVIAVLTGERSRKYEPAVTSFEVRNRETKERFMVEIGSANGRFMLALPPGDYDLIRVQINEGPFISIAQLDSRFSIGRDPITYLGT